MMLDPLLPSRVTMQLKEHFGENQVILHRYIEKKNPQHFAVRLKDGRTESSIAVSQVLRSYPTQNLSLILIDPNIRENALASNAIISWSYRMTS